MMSPDEAAQLLDEFRQQIDEIDIGIIDLLNQRTRIVEKIGAVKREAALPVYEPKREDMVYRNVIAHNQGPLSEPAVRRLFERIIDEMRTLQRERNKEENQQ
ncbi:MAG TPA: chorismate mutase [Bryobacteraceae bacterium]|nr:chorismate mutase [Bryobacteraceae bacterium]